MHDRQFDIQMDQVNAFLLELLRYRRRVMATVPDEIRRLKKHLNHVYLRDESRRIIPDYDLFFRIAVVILSRHSEPVSMGDLSKELDVPLSTATRVIDGLVDNGLAERLPDPEDRRIVRVTLTKRGQELYQIMNAFLRRHIEQILRQLSSEEVDQLVFLLQKITTAFVETEE